MFRLRSMSPLLSPHFAAAASDFSRRDTTVSPHFMPFYNHRFFSKEKRDDEKPLFLIDTLDVVRTLVGKGLPRMHAEVISDVLCDNLQNVSKVFVSKLQAEMIEKTHEVKFSEFKTEIQISQERNLSYLKEEIEKHNAAVDKLESKFRCEIDKSMANLRTHIEAEKFEMIKYCIGTILSLSVVGMAIICFY